MANYQLDQTGAEVQAILDAVQNPDTSPASASTNLITSGGVYSAVGSVASDLTELGQDVSPVLDAVDDLNWITSYYFNGTSSKAELTTPITLSTDGDSIEFKLNPITSADSKGFGFSEGGTSSLWRGIALTTTGIKVRSDDGTWLAGNSYPVACDTTHIKVSYESGKIIVYSAGVAVITYNGQKTISLYRFGHSTKASNTPYWDGTIISIKVNGVKYDLSQNTTLTNVVSSTNSSFLSEDEKEYYAPPLFVEKTSSQLNVYVKRQKGGYIGYPLVHTSFDYSIGLFADVWGIKKVFHATFDGEQMTKEDELFMNSEAELAMRVTIDGTTDYIGGSMHGYEAIVGSSIVLSGDREISFLIDNISVDESATYALKSCNSIRVIQHSRLYPFDKSEPHFADVYKVWTFSEKGMSIKTTMNLNQTISFVNCYMGMMGVYRRWLGNVANDYLTNVAIKKNLPFTKYDISDGWDSSSANPLANIDPNCTEITEYGQKDFGFSMEITEGNLPGGGMMVSHNGNDYNKIYYGTTTQGSYTGEWQATQIWRIF